MIRRKRMRMKRSRSPTSSSHYLPYSSSRYSPSLSSSHYSSSSVSFSSSSPSMFLSPSQILAFSATKINTFSNPNSPELSSQSPLPPRPWPDHLMRTIYDPLQLLPHSTSLTPQKSALRSVSRNLMVQLPPLPPSPLPPSKQQQHLLRRTILDPVPLTSSPYFQQEKQKGKKIEQAAVEAEKLSGEWFVVKFNCDSGEDNHYLVNASDSKYHKVLW